MTYEPIREKVLLENHMIKYLMYSFDLQNRI